MTTNVTSYSDNHHRPPSIPTLFLWY